MGKRSCRGGWYRNRERRSVGEIQSRELDRPWPEFSKLRIPPNCRTIRHEECMIVRNWPPAWETLGNLRSAETKQIGETPAFVYGCHRDFDLCQQFLLMSHRVSKSGLLRLRHRKRGFRHCIYYTSTRVSARRSVGLVGAIPYGRHAVIIVSLAWIAPHSN